MKYTDTKKLMVIACSLFYITAVVQLEASENFSEQRPRYSAPHASELSISSLKRNLEQAQQLNRILTTSLQSNNERFKEFRKTHQNYATERNRAKERADKAEIALGQIAETCILLNKENTDLHARVTELSHQLLLSHALPVLVPLKEPTEQRD